MSWRDRDYAREPAPRPYRAVLFGGTRTRSVAKTLIWVNVGAYILCALAAGPGREILAGLPFQFGAMQVELVMRGQIWRLMTSDYLHWGPGHLFMNMLALYFLGPPLEQVWGPRRFFVFYSLAGILGSLFFMILVLTGYLDSGIAAGASGCVLGVLGAAAVLFPHAQVYVWALFPVKLRTLAFILAGLYVLNLWNRGQNAGGDACHLAGLAFGAWYAFRGRSGSGWGLLRALSSRWPRTGSRDDRQPGFKQRREQRRADEQTIDRVLGKVHSQGIHSLTDAERRALADATARQRAEDPDFVD